MALMIYHKMKKQNLSFKTVNLEKNYAEENNVNSVSTPSDDKIESLNLNRSKSNNHESEYRKF